MQICSFINILVFCVFHILTGEIIAFLCEGEKRDAVMQHRGIKDPSCTEDDERRGTGKASVGGTFSLFSLFALMVVNKQWSHRTSPPHQLKRQ